MKWLWLEVYQVYPGIPCNTHFQTPFSFVPGVTPAAKSMGLIVPFPMVWSNMLHGKNNSVIVCPLFFGVLSHDSYLLSYCDYFFSIIPAIRYTKRYTKFSWYNLWHPILVASMAHQRTEPERVPGHRPISWQMFYQAISRRIWHWQWG